MRPALVYLCIIIIGLVIGCEAATIQVPCCNIATLRAFIDNSTDGTVFQLAAGTFTGGTVYRSDQNPAVLTNSYSYIGSPAGTVIDCEYNCGYFANLDTPSPNVAVVWRDLTFARVSGTMLTTSYLPNGQAATMSLINVTFRDCIEKPITWFSNGNLLVSNCSFLNTSSLSNTGQNGGAMALRTSVNATITIQNSVFSATSCDCHGGAIYSSEAIFNTTVAIINSTFSGSKSALQPTYECSGGALSLGGAQMTYLIDGCTFTGNRAFFGGGAVHIYSGPNTISIRNSRFFSNYADGPASNRGFGGAIRLEAYCSATDTGVTPTTITGCTFVGNWVTHNGGAIMVDNSTHDCPVVITNSTFTGNTANWGGAMSLGGRYIAYTITNNIIQSNILTGSPVEGGGIDITNGPNTHLFTSNTITDHSASYGGGICIGTALNSQFTFVRGSISRNTATSTTSGGGGMYIYASTGLSISMTSTRISHNYSPANNGGGLCTVDGLLLSNLTLTNVLFHNNTGLSGGGANLGGTGCRYVLTNCNFVNNTSPDHAGGGIYTGCAVGGNTYFLQGSTFQGNHAGVGTGAGVSFECINSVHVVTNSNFVANNNTGGSGGGLAVVGAGATLTVSGSTFTDNVVTTFTLNGAGICVTGTGQSVTIVDSTFVHNVNRGNGAAVYTVIDAGSVTMANNTFTRNVAVSGGAMHVQGVGSTFVVDRGFFQSNSVTNAGGAIYLDGRLSNWSVTNSTFIDNTADQLTYFGSALSSLVQRGSVVIANCTIQQNKLNTAVSFSGGPNVTITGSSFTQNTGNVVLRIATDHGVPSTLNPMTLLVADTRFSSNSGSDDGGVISMTGTNLLFNNVLLRNVTFSGNKGRNGGVLGINSPVAGNSFSLVNCIFDRNTAAQYGGAIYHNTLMLISGCTFSNNICAQNGGAISVPASATSASTSVLASTRFTFNRAGGLGGSISNEAGTISVAPDTVFVGNNLNAGPAPFEGWFGAGQTCASPGAGSFTFPYNVSGCPGIVGYPCTAVCPDGYMINATQETSTCSAGASPMSPTCIVEPYFMTAWVGNNAPTVAAPANYGTLNVFAPSNLMGARGQAGVIHSARYPYMALITCGRGVNEYGGAVQNLDDTWLIDTTDPMNVKTKWIYGSRNTSTDARASDYANNKMAPRNSPQVWTDGSTAFLFGGSALADLWTLDLDAPSLGWTFSSTGSSIGTPNPPANYGSLGVASATSHPGGRSMATIFQLPGAVPHAVFMYGGTEPGGNMLGDIWMFNCTSRLWMWTGGNGTLNAPGNYAAFQAFDPRVTPGARNLPMIWGVNTDLFLFGGAVPNGPSNNLWAGTLNTTSFHITWEWLAFPPGPNAPSVNSQPGVFILNGTPNPTYNAQFMISEEINNYAGAYASTVYIYGGSQLQGATQTTLDIVWAVHIGFGSAWVSGHLRAPNRVYNDSTTLNGPFVPGTPGPRHQGMVWPDHARPGEFLVTGGYSSAVTQPASGALNQRIYRIAPKATAQLLPASAVATIVGRPFNRLATVTLYDGTVIGGLVTNVSVSPAGAVATLVANTPGQVTIGVGIPITAYWRAVTVTLYINDRFPFTIPVNLTCPFNCDSCTATQTPDYCSGCDYRVGLAWSNANAACICNATAGLGKQASTGQCGPCLANTERYIAPNGDCANCTKIIGCAPGQLTCTGTGDSKCGRCNTGLYILPTAGADLCVQCATTSCPSYLWQSVQCSTNADRVCSPCTQCSSLPGTYLNTTCTPTTDSVCEPCAPIMGCVGAVTCTTGAATLCSRCTTGTFLVSRYPSASDQCPDCSVCPAGKYQYVPCTSIQDTVCRTCTHGCGVCTDVGLTDATCSACNETAGYGLNMAGTACVNSCPIGEYLAPGNATTGILSQCTFCTPGCAACSDAGLEILTASGAPSVCSACNETDGFRLSPGATKCVDVCPTGYYANDTAEHHFCHTCEGVTCKAQEFRHCTDPSNSECQACTTGCGDCTGLGLDTSEYCISCDTALGWARDANGLCVPCAANCTTCSTSPVTCIACANGYGTPPDCAPVCSSPGCVSCQAPEACLLCGDTYMGGDCKKCNGDVTQVGSAYPNCVAARQTDVVSTGSSMALLLVLCIVVTVVVFLKPLPVFYGGDQVIKTPSQDIPLSVDYILSIKRLSLSMSPPVGIENATLEGVGIMPGSLPFKQEDEKAPYTVELQMSQKQSNIFLARKMHIELHQNAGSGSITHKHMLAVLMRITGANLLAVFTIILDFVQLSSFGFGPTIVWWHSDPVQHTLRFTLIQLPAAENLWEIAYWVLVGLSAIFIVLVIFLKSGADAKLAKYSAFKAVSGPIYSILMPIVGQTLYLPIVTTMLGALACSRPVTDPNGHFVANFDENLICWSGEHFLFVIVSAVVLLIYYPLAVYTSPLWQTIDPGLDVRYFPAYLVVSGQMKFILSVTAQLFAKVPFLLSVLLIVLPLPVVVMVIRRPPCIIHALRWPIAASYASVSWSGIASLIAISFPDVWYTSVILYSGWVLLLGVSLVVALKRPAADEEKKAPSGADALRRVLATDASKTAHPSSSKTDNAANEAFGPPAPDDPTTVGFGVPVELEVVPVAFAPKAVTSASTDAPSASSGATPTPVDDNSTMAPADDTMTSTTPTDAHDDSEPVVTGKPAPAKTAAKASPTPAAKKSAATRRKPSLTAS